MAICTADFCNKIMIKLQKKSMVPLPCQESQLDERNAVHSEDVEWVLDLKEKIPIWSRLNEINTSGYRRKLPMSMTKSYDIEIKQRLWSLWSSLRKIKIKSSQKPNLATNVMALCAACVYPLNSWNPNLLNAIDQCGRNYCEENWREWQDKLICLKLNDLADECCPEEIQFSVTIETSQKGALYGVPLQGGFNLAYALINFLKCHRYGIIECCQRFVTFGFESGPQGGYFMFDGQSRNFPLFPRGYGALYILRTNHLQILLYCIVVTLAVPQKEAEFCIHNVEIQILKLPKIHGHNVKRCWKMNTPKTSLPSQPKYRIQANCCSKNDCEHLKTDQTCVKPNNAVRDDMRLGHDFVKMICSQTIIPMTREEKLARRENSFVTTLLDALIWRPIRVCNKN
uniref:Uncharacterized protein n=1 Tax=Stomoxys calcitrans TaxID=35570 RepID=A0A1I8QEV1_STOCA